MKGENLNLERTFFDLYRRVVAPGYTGVDGIPALTSKDLRRVDKKKIVVSNGARWTKLVTSRQCYIWTPDFRQIDYLPGHHPGDVSGDATKPWLKCVNGALKLYAPGEWHFKTPVADGKLEGEYCTLLVADAPTGFDASSMDSGDLAGIAKTSSVNLTRLGGTLQTGADFGALVESLLTRLLPLTLGAPATVVVNAADVLILAANANRRGVVLVNTGATQIAVGTQNPMTGMTDGFTVLDPGEQDYYGPMDFVTTQALRGYGSAAAGSIRVTEGT